MSTNNRILVPTAPFALLPTCPEHRVSRRDVLKMSLAMGTLGFASPLIAAEKEAAGLDFKGPMPTPDQILGPFYPVQKGTDGGADLARAQVPARPRRKVRSSTSQAPCAVCAASLVGA